MRPDGLFARALTAYCRGPEHPAKFRLVRWLGRRVWPEPGVAAPVPAGVRLYLHPRDWIEYLLLRGEAYEPLVLAFLRANLASGETAVLAGVNFGLHVIVAAQAVGAEGTVVGVEPQPTTVARALRNLDLNGLSGQIQIVLAALGEEPGAVALASPPVDNAGAASLLDAGAGRAGGSPCTALLVPLDDLRTRLGLDPIRLLLLDVQGYEPRVLAGLRREPLPEIVVVEANRPYLARDGSDVGRLVAALRNLGYEVFDLHGRPSDGSTPPPEVNLIGVQPSRRVCWLPAGMVP